MFDTDEIVIMAHIVSLLSLAEVLAFCQVNVQIAKMARSEAFWSKTFPLKQRRNILP